MFIDKVEYMKITKFWVNVNSNQQQMKLKLKGNNCPMNLAGITGKK